ncbi:SatD family protein [Nocardioides coralli]|nr:SatD family protein [Nocardioides coralli]
MKSPAVVVIGDLVGSRRSVDRRALHANVSRALRRVNDRFEGDLRLTVGDEYQGSFPHLGAALRATLALRLALLPAADARHGVGVGPVEALSGPGRIEDGPGWWAARDAIDAVERAEGRAATRTLRTAYRLTDGVDGVEPAAVNAALVGRDAMVGRLSDRGLSVLAGLLSGMTQREIAEAEGVSTSAISQRVRHDGLGMLLTLDADLGELR